jgi:hypothetical protein
VYHAAVIRQLWDPSVPSSYTWEVGALYQLPLASIEPHEVMRVLWGGPWWVLEMGLDFFQVVGRSYTGRVLTIFVTRLRFGDFSLESNQAAPHMRIDGARLAEPFEEKYFLEVSGGGAGE